MRIFKLSAHTYHCELCISLHSGLNDLEICKYEIIFPWSCIASQVREIKISKADHNILCAALPSEHKGKLSPCELLRVLSRLSLRFPKMASSSWDQTGSFNTKEFLWKATQQERGIRVETTSLVITVFPTSNCLIKIQDWLLFAGISPPPPVCVGARNKQKDRRRLLYFPSS